MDADPLDVNIYQPPLFNLGDTSSGSLELYPAIWGALEALTSPDTALRQSGLERLAKLGAGSQLNAARLSPLVSCMVAGLLDDADLPLRRQALRIVADVYRLDTQGQPAPEPVRQHLDYFIGRMRTRRIFCLLQAALLELSAEDDAALLLARNPYAGSQLAEIVADRKEQLDVRRMAATLTGRIGYLDAVPTLERVAARLLAKLEGQQAMPFVTSPTDDEVTLLPVVDTALARLKAP